MEVVENKGSLKSVVIIQSIGWGRINIAAYICLELFMAHMNILLEFYVCFREAKVFKTPSLFYFLRNILKLNVFYNKFHSLNAYLLSLTFRAAINYSEIRKK